MRKLSVLFGLLVYGYGASLTFAQFDTATVVGTVRDTSGGVIPGAKVTLTSAGTGISVVKTSTDDGNFSFRRCVLPKSEWPAGAFCASGTGSSSHNQSRPPTSCLRTGHDTPRFSTILVCASRVAGWQDT